MNDVAKEFHLRCKAYSILGFRRKATGYWRVKNDILQTFFLKQSRDGKCGDIAFGVYPLCMGIDSPVGRGSYVLHKFDVRTAIIHDGWSYSNYDGSTIDEILFPVFELMECELIPFFERIHDCESALVETINLDKLFDENRKRILHHQGQIDRAEPVELSSMLYPEKVYFALRAGNYEYAKRCVSVWVSSAKKQWQEANFMLLQAETKEDVLFYSYDCKHKQSLYKKYCRYASILELANRSDIEKVLLRNEMQSRKKLKL